MNQFYVGNTEIDYPFIALPSRPAAEQAWLADAVFRVSSESDIFADPATHIELDTIDTTGGLTLVFKIVGGTYNDWTFTSTTGPFAEFKRMTLALADDTATPRPEKGYGYVILGTTDPSSGVGTSLGLEMSQSTIRLLGSNPDFSIRLANAPCPGDTVPAGTPGTPVEVQYQGRSTQIIAGCVEIGIYPPGDPNAGDPLPQVAVTPDTVGANTSEVAVPTSPENIELIEFDTITTITLTPLSVNDALPADPGYDVDVIAGGPITPGPEVFAGHNAVIAGNVNTPSIEVAFALGRGDGFTCDPVPGCAVGVKASDALKSILGVYGEALEFVPGTGVDVLPSPGDNRIYFVFNAQRLTSVST